MCTQTGMWQVEIDTVQTVMCVALEHRSAVQVRSVYKSKERDTDRKIIDRHVFVYALFSTNSA